MQGIIRDIKMAGSEIETLKMVLGLTFQKNISFFKEKNTAIYSEFNNYTPEKWGLDMDPQGCLNLGCNGQFVYPDNPQISAKKQVEKFLDDPVSTKFKLAYSWHNRSLEHIHGIVVEHIDDLAKPFIESNSNQGTDKLATYPLVCCLGIGMGFHLEELVKQDIHCLSIFEPNKDFFYASLHLIDYTWLFEQFSQGNRHLTLVVGQTTNDYLYSLFEFAQQRGNHHFANLPIFTHYESDSMSDILTQLSNNVSMLYTGFGFCEDEIQSHRNSLINALGNRTFFLDSMQQQTSVKLKNVIICGAGPSLDESYDFINENRDNALVISCGTSLRALHGQGITPDIHIEVERTEHVVDWLTEINDEKYLQKMILIAPNTLSKKVCELFSSVLMYLKPRDAGSALLNELSPNRKLAELIGCNPTVTNGAITIANFLGAKNVYLAGVDLGFKSNTHHHAKGTAYYNTSRSLAQMNGDIERVAARGGTVMTTEVFDWARINIENVIEHSPDMRVFNCSDGVVIEGAELVNPTDIASLPVFNLKRYLKTLSSPKNIYSAFSRKLIARTLVKNIMQSDELIKYLVQRERQNYAKISFEHLLEYFLDNNLALAQKSGNDNLVASRLLSGSLNYIQIIIIGNLFRIHSQADRNEYIEQALIIMKAHFEELNGFITKQLSLKAQKGGAKC